MWPWPVESRRPIVVICSKKCSAHGSPRVKAIRQPVGRPPPSSVPGRLAPPRAQIGVGRSCGGASPRPHGGAHVLDHRCPPPGAAGFVTMYSAASRPPGARIWWAKGADELLIDLAVEPLCSAAESMLGRRRAVRRRRASALHPQLPHPASDASSLDPVACFSSSPSPRPLTPPPTTSAPALPQSRHRPPHRHPRFLR
jgi:hypothetical protein